jgi:hypothetical protein
MRHIRRLDIKNEIAFRSLDNKTFVIVNVISLPKTKNTHVHTTWKELYKCSWVALAAWSSGIRLPPRRLELCTYREFESRQGIGW